MSLRMRILAICYPALYCFQDHCYGALNPFGHGLVDTKKGTWRRNIFLNISVSWKILHFQEVMIQKNPCRLKWPKWDLTKATPSMTLFPLPLFPLPLFSGPYHALQHCFSISQAQRKQLGSLFPGRFLGCITKGSAWVGLGWSPEICI